MENNENEFQNGSASGNNTSTDPFSAVDNGAYTQAEDPFASVQNSGASQNYGTDNGYTQPNYGADNGYTQASGNGSYVQPPMQQESQAFAIASMVLGIISLVCCCLGNISLIMAVLSIVFAVITLVKKRPGKGMAVAGIICAGLAIVIYIAFIIIGFAIGSSISPSDLQDLENYLMQLENASYY